MKLIHHQPENVGGYAKYAIYEVVPGSLYAEVIGHRRSTVIRMGREYGNRGPRGLSVRKFDWNKRKTLPPDLYQKILDDPEVFFTTEIL